jgi:hypothetical protein
VVWWVGGRTSPNPLPCPLPSLPPGVVRAEVVVGGGFMGMEMRRPTAYLEVGGRRLGCGGRGDGDDLRGWRRCITVEADVVERRRQSWVGGRWRQRSQGKEAEEASGRDGAEMAGERGGAGRCSRPGAHWRARLRVGASGGEWRWRVERNG